MSGTLAQDLQTVGTQQMVAVFLEAVLPALLLCHLPWKRRHPLLQIQDAIPDSHCSGKESPFPPLCVEFIYISVTVLFHGNAYFLLGIVLSTSRVLL